MSEQDKILREIEWTTAYVNSLPDASFAVILVGGKRDETNRTEPRALRKLPFKDAAGKVDLPHLRNALARLPQIKGVSQELKSRASGKLKAAAKKHLKTYQKEALDAMRILTADITALAEQIINLTEAILADDESALMECQLAESDVGSVIALHESQSVDKGAPEPLQLDVVVIEPGWGNDKDNHYYSPDMLKEYAHVFKGAKMYATNHKAEDKSVLTEVSQVLECPVSFTDTGAPVARVGIFNDDFAAGIRNREALGKLDGLHVSILASGTARDYEQDGRKGKCVESIAAGANVDWVTRAGAGGRALRLAENETEPDGGIAMTDQAKEKEKQEPTEEPTKEQPIKETGTAEPKPQPVLLSETDVKTALDASKLPDVSREKLAGSEYEDTSAIDAAIAAEAEYVTALTGAGKPVGQDVRPAQQTPADNQKAYETALDEIDKRYGVVLPYQQQGE